MHFKPYNVKYIQRKTGKKLIKWDWPGYFQLPACTAKDWMERLNAPSKNAFIFEHFIYSS